MIAHIFNTIFGFYQQKFSAVWDETLNDIIDNWDVISVDQYTIQFESEFGNTIEIWISSKWFSYGHAYTIDSEAVPRSKMRRPKFSTMQKLSKFVTLWTGEESMKQYFSHENLEKSSIIRVRISYVRQWFFKPHTVRIANAREFYWLGLNICIRRPWLLSSAKSLHPELFNKGKS